MPIDTKSMWDFSDPAGSAARFAEAAQGAGAEEAVVLQTQIARTWGLRHDFRQARGLLRGCEAQRDAAGPRAAVHWWLEWGRTFASAAHQADEVTDADRDEARHAFDAAFAAARDAGLDELAVDALHMRAIAEPDPADQIAINERALEFLRASNDRAARSWEASILNNIGMSYHDAGDLQSALEAFQAALDVRRADGNAANERVARWMVAWTLRLLGRNEEALAIQEQLDLDAQAANAPHPFVLEELQKLYTTLNRPEDAARVKARAEG